MRRITVRSHLNPKRFFFQNIRQTQRQRWPKTLGAGGGGGESASQRTGRPQPTQSSITVPSLFTVPPPFGVGVPAAAAGVPASRGGVPGLELGSVLL